MDFTLTTYHKLLETFQEQRVTVQPFADFVASPAEKVIVLRHDVDRLPDNSIVFARIQAERGIKGTYYFRVVPASWDESIIREIESMGHEIGYHYEDLSLVAKRQKIKVKRQNINAQGIEHRVLSKNPGDHSELETHYTKQLFDDAIESFSRNLDRLRKLADVRTICMHGSPTSRWDSRLLWKYYDYKDFGIIGEPYFDVDFTSVLYLTDTGRRWDGESVSVRDKAVGSELSAQGKERKPEQGGRQVESENSYRDWKIKPFKFRQESKAQSENNFQPATSNQQPVTTYRFHSTSDIIKVTQEDKLPNKIMMTFHPQRWSDKPLPWFRELIWQNIKNPAKYFLIKHNKRFSK